MAAKKKSTKKSSKKTTTKKSSKKSSELDKVLEQIPSDQKKQLEVIKDAVDAFKDKIVKRLEGYVMGVALLPPSKDEKEKENINVLILIDDQDSTKIPKHELHEKVQNIAVEVAKDVNPNLAPQMVLLSDLWQQCYDGKHELLQLIAMSASVYDTGMLAAVKISEVHKTMVLKKFEKYIVSYVLAGSLVQGKATPESDIDVFVVIDDTDVKKMTRVELRDKLRAIIIGMGAEAGQVTGIQNKINIQVYILTDFWENIKDANPVIFTFLRDGVPFYDRGVFMPWKQLLQMGRIKPSPEAIEMFRGSGSQFMERINHKIRDIVMDDLFWALLTPSQAALMMYGVPPTTPKETPHAMRDLLVKKEALLEDEYVKTLEKVLQLRKEFEHGTKKAVSGKEMDDLIKGSDKYLQRLDKLFKEIELRKQEEQVLHNYETIITIIRDVLQLEGIAKAEEKNLPALFKEHIIEKGFIAERYNRILQDILKGKKDYDAKKLTKQEVHDVIKGSKELTNVLIEFIQRRRGQELEKTRIKVKYGDSFGEVILLGDYAYVVEGLDNEEKKVSKAKIIASGSLSKREEISFEEFEEVLVSSPIPPKTFIKSNLFDDLRVIFGSDVEILINN